MFGAMSRFKNLEKLAKSGHLASLLLKKMAAGTLMRGAPGDAQM